MSLLARRRIWNFFECLYENQLDENSSRQAQPEWIKTPLLAHQQCALAAALQHESAKTGRAVSSLPGESLGGTFFCQYGILADRVGSGKSLLALSLLRFPPPPSQFSEYIYRSNSSCEVPIGLLRERDQLYTSNPGIQLRAVATALFIIPHALMAQWEDYVRQDTHLQVAFIRKRKDAADPELFNRLNGLDAICISSTMWREFVSNYPVSTILWSRMFVDEADSISVVVEDGSVFARFYWLITASWMNLVFPNGTYINIENNVPPPDTVDTYVSQCIQKYRMGAYLNIDGTRNQFIRRIVGNLGITSYNTTIINPVVFHSTRALIHSKESFIRQSFEITDIQHQRILCLAPANIQILHNMISDDMMERLHAGDPVGVLEILGMQTKSASEIIQAVTESIQKELESVRLFYVYKQSIEYSCAQARQKSLEQLEGKIARLESRIDSIKKRLTDTTAQTCPICFCDVTTPSITPCCRNLFCFACICQVLKHTSVCPLCREVIHGVQTIQVLGEATGPCCEPQKVLNKQDTIRNFLLENPQARVLTFSVYDATFHGLSTMLENEGIAHTTLNGSQARITKVLQDFDKGKYRVLFLNARNMGAGLNITPATHVVLYHKMTIETQNQIIGRAMRMGRKEPLTVLHLLHGNEMPVSPDVIEHV